MNDDRHFYVVPSPVDPLGVEACAGAITRIVFHAQGGSDGPSDGVALEAKAYLLRLEQGVLF